MDDTKNIKIIDFGFSVIAPPETVHTVFCGTPSNTNTRFKIYGRY